MDSLENRMKNMEETVITDCDKQKMRFEELKKIKKEKKIKPSKNI